MHHFDLFQPIKLKPIVANSKNVVFKFSSAKMLEKSVNIFKKIAWN